MLIASEHLYFEPYHKQYRASYSSEKRVCVAPIKKLLGRRPWAIRLQLHDSPVENSRPIRISNRGRILYSLKPNIKRPRGQFFWGVTELLRNAMEAAGLNPGLHTLYLTIKEL